MGDCSQVQYQVTRGRTIADGERIRHMQRQKYRCTEFLYGPASVLYKHVIYSITICMDLLAILLQFPYGSLAA